MLDKNGGLLTQLDAARISVLQDQGVIDGGMIPKVHCALNAVEAGVKASHIIDGRVNHALLLEVLTDKGVGSLITSQLA